MSIYRIGSQAVNLHGEPPSCLSGLRRFPRPAAVPMVELALTLTDRRDWPLGTEAAPGRYIKGQDGHRLDLDFAGRCLALRTLRCLSATQTYLWFRDLFCGLAGLSGEVLLHGAAVIGGNAEVLLFCGASGAGKSTIVGLLRQAREVVNDEINWAFREDGRWLLVNQRCWWREGSAYPPAVPLRRVFLLEQAAHCAVEPVTPADAYALLLTAPFGGHDPLLPRRAEATADLSRDVPLARLLFNLDAAAIENLVFAHETGSRA
jgi:hypothetical protein